VPNIYQLKVTLQGTHPPIWRRLIVPGNLNFARLHAVIQDAMGWEDYHLHSFKVGDLEIGNPNPNRFSFGPPIAPEKQYTLDRVACAKEARFTYVYDFGDCWEHEIVVETVTVGELEAPRCVAGERACPPEDCGGIPGYTDLVDALADQTHERHDELTRWVDDGWSPERFDLAAADRRVAMQRPQPGRPRPANKHRGRARARA
jgi:Plasmid pRiA4b ORF-3-like protein